MTATSEIKNHEKECLDELRKRMAGEVEQEIYEDINLFYKFLKVRNFNVDNAEAMLRKHVQWREKHDVKNILNLKKVKDFERYIPYHFIGYDKDGSPVRYLDVGSFDFLGVIASCRSEDGIKLIVSEFIKETEELKNQSKKLGKNVNDIVYIYNLKKLSFGQVTDRKVLSYCITVISMFQSNFPERQKAIYFFNAPSFYNVIFSMLKPFACMHIIERLHIYSDDSYKEDLLKIIDKDVLPAFLGGTKTDPDGNPLCLSFIKYGQPVPETLYIHRSKRSLANCPGVKRILLTRGAFHEIILEVKEPGSQLEWEFETKRRDIGFGLFYKETTNGEMTNSELIPIHRIDTDNYAEAGLFKCTKAGSYVMVFDNTYSWIRGKEIFYRHKIVTPKELEAELTS